MQVDMCMLQAMSAECNHCLTLMRVQCLHVMSSGKIRYTRQLQSSKISSNFSLREKQSKLLNFVIL